MWWMTLVLVACEAPQETPTDGGPTDDVTVTHSGTSGSTPTLPPDSGTGHTGVPMTSELMPWERSTFDCSTIPRGPVVGTNLAWSFPSEDFTLDADGYLWGVPGGILKRQTYGGVGEPVVPGLGDVRGSRFLPDGRIALSHPEDGSVYLVDPVSGSGTVGAAGLNTPNGIAIDFEGRVAVATSERIVRIDPATGAVDELVFMDRRSFDGLTYSPDFKRLYFNEELGRVHWIDFADDGTWSEPQGPITLIPNPLIAFAILDGMATDVCGNLYANEMNGKVWRVWPDGEVELVANIGGASIIPALNFGIPARDGWIADHLYVMNFLGTLIDLPVGVPGKWEPHMPWPAVPE